MRNPVVVKDFRQAQFFRRESVASEMDSLHQNMRVIAITIERRRAVMHAANQRIDVLQLRLLTSSDRQCDQNMPSRVRVVEQPI